MALLELRKIESPSPLSEVAYRAIKESLLATGLSQSTNEQRLDERAFRATWCQSDAGKRSRFTPGHRGVFESRPAQRGICGQEIKTPDD